MAKLVRTRPQARQDARTVITRYRRERAPHAVEGFVQALSQAYEHIGRHPASGCPRYAERLKPPGLRYWPLQRYPYLVFYREHPEYVLVWRVLHRKRDIPASMRT
ncbi:type II toxin-antitoxin system RelE/ParE family toxin [Steroidobacter flavus]|uniref:Type II toxin-antitoxin system RelE/ParE family toxin n=1 Tax=Steroidobacter flavus TaxID=1842136 RepID=A0ABV8SXU9_9GAMM